MALASFPPSFIIQSQAPSSRRSQVPGGHIRGGSADRLHLSVPSPRQTTRVSGQDVSESVLAGEAFSKQALGGRSKHRGSPSLGALGALQYLTHHPHRGHEGFGGIHQLHSSSCGPVMTTALHILSKLLPTTIKAKHRA